jgi:hypothetical protein
VKISQPHITSLKNLKVNSIQVGKKKRLFLICGKFLAQSPSAGQEKPRRVQEFPWVGASLVYHSHQNVKKLNVDDYIDVSTDFYWY